YARRAATGIGLIVTEGIGVAHPMAVDRPGTPVHHGEDAVAGWRDVIAAVHAAGGLIWTQLWHQGPMWNVEHDGGRHAEALRPSGIWGPPDGA
ncbi:12-oxophytodienoate reductase, partial [Escherichia coli]|nr:12-oxophytodienoate reductase [Escherichia coli]